MKDAKTDKQPLTAVIAGKKVKVANPVRVKIVSEQVKRKYAKVLENLKNR